MNKNRMTVFFISVAFIITVLAAGHSFLQGSNIKSGGVTIPEEPIPAPRRIETNTVNQIDANSSNAEQPEKTAGSPATPSGFDSAAEEQVDYYSIETAPVEAMYLPPPSSLKGIEDNVSHIVSGSVADLAGYKSDPSRGAFTLRELTVTNVYKGDLKSGQKVTIGERFVVDYLEGKPVLFYLRNYLPSKENQEYLFFLVYNEINDFYQPRYVDLSRYPVISAFEGMEEHATQSLTDEELTRAINAIPNVELSLGIEETAEYRERYAEVVKKYMQ